MLMSFGPSSGGTFVGWIFASHNGSNRRSTQADSCTPPAEGMVFMTTPLTGPCAPAELAKACPSQHELENDPLWQAFLRAPVGRPDSPDERTAIAEAL
jgi:hypothetical protein